MVRGTLTAVATLHVRSFEPLVREAEARLAALGCAKVNLQVRAINADVVAFYESLDYEVEERVSLGRRLE